MVGREDQRGADQGGVFQRHAPGLGHLLVHGFAGKRLAGYGSGQQAQDAGACLQHGRAVLDPTRMIPARGCWQQNEATVDRREGGGSLPGAAERGRQGRQIARCKGPVVAVPEKLRDLLQRGAACETSGIMAAIVETAVLDQRQRGFEDGCAEVEGVCCDGFRLASDVAASLEPRDVFGAVPTFALPRAAFGTQ